MKFGTPTVAKCVFAAVFLSIFAVGETAYAPEPVTEPAAEQQSTAEVTEPAAEQQPTAEVTEPAAEQQPTAEVTEPAAERYKGNLLQVARHFLEKASTILLAALAVTIRYLRSRSLHTALLRFSKTACAGMLLMILGSFFNICTLHQFGMLTLLCSHDFLMISDLLKELRDEFFRSKTAINSIAVVDEWVCTAFDGFNDSDGVISSSVQVICLPNCDVSEKIS